MASAETPLPCRNSDCTFAETGKCVEAHDVDSCPHRQQIDNGEVIDSADGVVSGGEDGTEDVSNEGTANRFNLGRKKTLDLGGASALLRKASANLIATIGPVKAGKTCLIAAMYDTFQYSQYNAYTFAGSQTLAAFEGICHSARSTSQAGDLLNPRTKSSEHPFFYHLSISEHSGQELNNLLLADRSGEIYEEICKKPSVAEECLELERADLLNVLVDGLKLCDRFQRAAMISTCQNMMLALSESGVVPPALRVNLVLTKCDDIEVSENKESAYAAFKDLAARIEDQCGSVFTKFSMFNVVAVRKHNVLVERYGLEALLQSWLEPVVPAQMFVSKTVTSNRAFGTSVMPNGGTS